MNGSFFFEFVQNFRFELSESFQRNFMDIVLDLILFFVISQFVNKDSFGLMSPKSDQEDFRFETHSGSTQDNISSHSNNSFEDSREFSHIENVMEFSGSG